MPMQVLIMINLSTKFEISTFTRFTDTIDVPKFKRVTWPWPIWG